MLLRSGALKENGRAIKMIKVNICGQHQVDGLHGKPHGTKGVNTMQDELKLGDDRTFRDLYESLANEYCKENHQLYTAIAPLLGLKPFYGTCNKEQVIWAKSQDEANNLPAGANIHKYIKIAMKPLPAAPEVGGLISDGN